MGRHKIDLDLTVSKYDLYKKRGLTDKQIAAIFYVSPSVIMKWKKGRKLARTSVRWRKVPFDFHTYYKHRIDGMPDSGIARLYKISPTQMHQWKYENGLDTNSLLKLKLKELENEGRQSQSNVPLNRRTV